MRGALLFLSLSFPLSLNLEREIAKDPLILEINTVEQKTNLISKETKKMSRKF